MSGFHDEDYDGIVLKIPSWFIKMNNLESAFDTFSTALQSANKSIFYNDHVNNLYELKNADVKIKQVAQKRQEEKNKEIKTKERNDKIHSGEMYELAWVEIKYLFDGDIKMPDGHIINSEEAFTKSGIKSSVQNEFQRQINSFDSLKNLAELNTINSILWSTMDGCIEGFIQCDYKLFQSTKGWEVLGLSLSRLCVKTDWSIGRKRGWLYRTEELIVCKDGCLAFRGGNKESRLEGFEKKGMYLIKTENGI